MSKGYREVRRKLSNGTEKVYRYSTETGEPLQGDPRSWAFKTAVKAAKFTGPTVNDLLNRYEKSEFRRLAKATQDNYRPQMERWRAKGDVPLERITRAVVMEMRDELVDRPGICSVFCTFTKRLFNIAIDLEMMMLNPATRVKAPPLKKIKRWPDEKVEAVIERMPDRFKVPSMLALYTGQRSGDVLKMKWSDYHGTHIVVAQQKTDMDEGDRSLMIPCHPKLRAFLDALERRAEVICTLNNGRPWQDSRSYARQLRPVLDELGLEGFSMHGLRKTAASRLAEAGCSAHEIMAITGHETLAMVELYTKEVQRRGMAVEAMKKLTATVDMTESKAA